MIATSKTFTPRKWQQNGLNEFTIWHTNRKSGDSRTFTAAITGAAGKTHWGAMLFNSLCKTINPEINTILVVVPSNNILNQWQSTLSEHGFDVKPFTNNSNFNAGFHGLLTTYKMLENNTEQIRHHVTRKTLVIFDEFHHLADRKMWGTVANDAAGNAGYRLMLTGTAFREDDSKIPFVIYKDGQLVTNFEYSYGEALADGHVRPLYFHALNANAKWQTDGDNLKSGILTQLSQSKTVTQTALNVALNLSNEYLPTLIKESHRELMACRKVAMPDAAAIITCIDQNHARKVQRLIQKLTHTNPVLAISDDPDSDEKIEKFRESKAEWLVVVRKGSEGLDIPRLIIGVWATNITTELSFLQFIYRLIRRRGEENEIAKVFLPAHPKLVEYAESIREMRIHTLAPPETANGTHGNLESIEAKPGESKIIAVTNQHPDDTLRLLVKIQELSAWAISDYAQFQNDISLNVTLHDIRQVLCKDEPVSQLEITPKRTPTQEYEYQRQWKIFLELFNNVQSGKDWYRDVLSYFWSYTAGTSIKAFELAEELAMPASRFTTHWKRDFKPLIDTGLIVADKIDNTLAYRNFIKDRLQKIASDHNTETLVGYLLTGQLPEQPE